MKANHTQRSFAKNQPTRNLFKKYCGTSMPDEFLANAAKQFVAEMFEPNANLTTRNPFVVKNKQSKVSASSAKDGAGALWIKLFSAYEGDECIVYPFVTAACPRGVVTFNFKAMPAHRAMCIKVNKLPPEPGMMALHRCGNGDKGCVTPKHLYWGDAQNNADDAVEHANTGKPICVAA